jgi:membrane protease YdiL (CAAX protease family)
MSNASSDAKDAKMTKGWPHPVLAIVVTAGLFLVCQLAAGLLLSLIAGLAGKPSLEQLFNNPVLLQFSFALLVYGSLLLSLRWYLRSRNLDWRQLGYRRPRWTDIIYVLLALVCYVAAFAVFQQLLTLVFSGLDVSQRQDTGFGDASGAGFVPLALTFSALVLLAPLAEETLMRGFLFGALRQRLPFVVSTLITSVMFAMLHLAGGEQGAGPLWIAAIDTFVLSLALCYLREKTGRLWPSIALHMLKNGIAFTALFIIGVGS